MAFIIEFTDPITHPKFVREQRQITETLADILVRKGRSERQAMREAEEMLAPQPPGREAHTRKPHVRRAGA